MDSEILEGAYIQISLIFIHSSLFPLAARTGISTYFQYFLSVLFIVSSRPIRLFLRYWERL